MMLEINEIAVNGILNPTSIDLGEYVINPYRGCEFSCLYCYVRSNKAVSKREKPWGTYVDVRRNAPDLLEKEIAVKRPKVVLLGSTTECFQPVEGRFHLTGKILEILNKNKVSYRILTRSPAIVEYLALLNQGFCKKIYFTVNNFHPTLKQIIEPKSPAFDARNNAVRILLNAGISVVPYYSPVIPWVTNIKGAFSSFPEAERIEFEYVNFKLKNTHEIIKHISLTEPALEEKFMRMLHERDYYEQTWEEFDKEIEKQAQEAKKEHRVYRHNFDEFFKNTYL